MLIALCMFATIVSSPNGVVSYSLFLLLLPLWCMVMMTMLLHCDMLFPPPYFGREYSWRKVVVVSVVSALRSLTQSFPLSKLHTNNTPMLQLLLNLGLSVSVATLPRLPTLCMKERELEKEQAKTSLLVHHHSLIPQQQERRRDHSCGVCACT